MKALAAPLTGLLLLSAPQPVWSNASSAPSGREPGELDPNLAHQLRLGLPAGIVPALRLGAGQSGRSSTSLPSRPRVLWRSRVRGPLTSGVAIDGQGNITLASTHADVVELDATGVTRWTTSIPRAEVAGGPVLAHDGTRQLVTTHGELVRLRQDGVLLSRRGLRLPAAPRAELLVADQGRSFVAMGSELVHVQSGGDLVAKTRAPERIAALLQGDPGLLVVTDRGRVFEWDGAGPLRPRGSFGGAVTGGVSGLGGTSLLAVVDGHRLVELDVIRGARRTRTADPALPLQAPAAVALDGGTRLLTNTGVLVLHDASAREASRVPLLEPSAVRPLGAVPEAAPPVVDRAGTTLVAVPGRAGVVHADGTPSWIPGLDCSEPLAAVPAGASRALVVCRSGLLWMVGD